MESGRVWKHPERSEETTREYERHVTKNNNRRPIKKGW